MGRAARHLFILFFLVLGLVCLVVAFAEPSCSMPAAILGAGLFIACGHLGAAPPPR